MDFRITSPRYSKRQDQLGVGRGCCISVVISLLPLFILLFILWRVMATPDLGFAPSGTSNGANESAIGANLATQLTSQLIGSPHAVIQLSENDLTVLAKTHDPNLAELSNPQARVRNGQVIVSAQSSFGPISVYEVAYFNVGLVPAVDVGSPPSVMASLSQIDLGKLTLPGWSWRVIKSHTDSLLNVNSVLNADPKLQVLEQNLECVSVTEVGVKLGFHRPGVVVDPGVCGR